MSITKTKSSVTKIKESSSVKNSPIDEVLRDLANELLLLMGTKSTANVTNDQENDSLVVTIEAGDETGLLIGRKGETLTSIQTILGIMLKQKVGEWKRVVVNVGDYREKEEDYLKNLGLNAVSRARETGEAQSLYNLNSAQRRIIHMALVDQTDIVAESVGEGNERYLVIRLK